MVASDTVVGLVGAGILLVALVGVFLYESGEIGTDLDVTAFTPSLAVDSNSKTVLKAQTGQAILNPLGGSNCTPPACTPPRTEAYFNATGLPAMTDLLYVGWLSTGTAHANLGALTYTQAQNRHSLSYVRSEDRTSMNQFLVSLEKGASATQPSLAVYSKPVKTNPDTTVLTDGSLAALGGGTHRVHVDDSTGNVQATVTYEGLANYTQVGFQYRAWLKKADGTYDHLANYTDFPAAEVAGGAPGTVQDWAEFVVTLENPTSKTDKPLGYGPLFTARLTSA